MAPLQRVFIDTSELFPFAIMDVLLTLAEDSLFTWVWTDQILDEWTDVIVREGKRTPESAAFVASASNSQDLRMACHPAGPCAGSQQVAQGKSCFTARC